MQRYRVNYTVLISILIGLSVGSGAVYGLWRFQVNRNARSLIKRAEQATEEEDYRAAAQLYHQFLSIRPNDDAIVIARANSWNEFINTEENPSREDLLNSYNVMEDTVRNHPEQHELRRQLVEILMSRKFRLYNIALEHVDKLLRNNPEDKDLMVLRARCMILDRHVKAESYSNDLIGFDRTTGKFDETKAKMPNSAIIYRNLADLLRQQRGRPEVADRVMDRLVDVNPDSYEAYLNRGQYYQSLKDKDGAESDFRKAYELNPGNKDVLLAMGSLYKDEENLDEAKQLFTVGNEKYPEDSRFYQQLADVAMRNSDYDKALEEVNRGIKAVKKADSLLLLAYKADLQIRRSDSEGVQRTIKEMETSGFRSEYVDWISARVLLSESKWFEASKALKKVRPLMNQFGGDIPSQINLQLGLCHEKLGQLELAKQSYEDALHNDPSFEPAVLGKQRIVSRMQIPGTAAVAPSWPVQTQEMLKLPKEQRDWTEIDQSVEKWIEEKQLSEDRQLLVRAEMKIRMQKYSEASQLVQMAYKLAPDDLNIQLLGTRLLSQDPDKGPAEALKFLEDRVIPKFVDNPMLRLEKANLLIAINDVELPQQLAALTEGIDAWSTKDKIQLWYGLAGKYFQIGRKDDALRAWTTVTELAPNDLPTRVMLFNVAHDMRDDASMQDAQKRILEVVDPKDPTYLYTEARRRLTLLRQGELAIEELPAIMKLVSTVHKNRPNWDQLHLLQAEIAMINGKEGNALKHYQEASALGRSPVGAVIQHVRLLVSRGRFKDAKDIVEGLPPGTPQQALGQLYAEILFNNNDVEAATKSAQLVVDQAPDNASKQLWYGQFMAKIAQTESLNAEQQQEADAKAGKAFRLSVDLDSSLQEAWLALISYQMYRKDRPKAEQALREAQLALSSERLPLMVAKCYEVMGRAFDAENLYQSAWEANPDDLFAARQLAVFYLTGVNGYGRPQRIARATPFLNTILRFRAEGKVPEGDANVVWARRTTAQLLANTGDYQNLRKAEKLLASNSKDGLLPMEDRLLMAQILAPRPEPISRKKALTLLKEAKEMHRLNPAAELILGQLYYAMGDWRECKSQMQEMISHFAGDNTTKREVLQARSTFILMCLEKNDTRLAERNLEKLTQIRPLDVNTLDLIAKVAAKTGKQQNARQALLNTLPKDLNTLSNEELPRVEKIADLFVAELDDKEVAFKLYRYLVSRNSTKVLKLAEFIGIHQEIEQCFDLLDQVYTPEAAPAVVQTAIKVVRAREQDAGRQFDDKIRGWLDTALRRDPESIPLLMQQAEFNDIRQNYNEAADGYNRLLIRHDLRGRGRAIVLNNLSYLLALQGGAAKQKTAMRLVREAVEILGPSPDILDTRAVVFIANQQFEDAIEDLKLSVTDNPTAAKYFHKTIAHLGAGQKNDAIKAWEEAEKLGLTRDNISRMERKQFDEVKSQIEKELSKKRQTASLGWRGAEQLDAGVLSTAMPVIATS